MAERAFAEFDFRQLLGDFTTGGLVIVDRFPDRDDDQVAFRTLLQLDGDVIFSIHADAVVRSDFAELLGNHQRHVRAVLEAKGKRLRLLASGFGYALGFVGITGVGAGVGLGDLTSFLQSLTVEWAIAASGSVGGVLLVARRRNLGDAVLSVLLRWWGFARDRLRPPER